MTATFETLRKYIPALRYVLAVAAGGTGVWGGTALLGDSNIEVFISPARAQMINEGVIDRKKLEEALETTVQQHFQQNGYPCDPFRAGDTLGDTLRRARACPTTTP